MSLGFQWEVFVVKIVGLMIVERSTVQRTHRACNTGLWLRGRSAVLVQADYSTVRSKQKPVLKGSATVNRAVTVNINAVNKRIRKAVPCEITGKEWNCLLN